jgi:steroid 5-alpha reductase family enzyme
MSLIMAVAWWVQWRSENSGWVDTIWSFGTGATALVCVLITPREPWSWRQILVAILVACWSLRLGLHIATRTHGVADDPRYRRLITQWGPRAREEMFWFLQKQAVVSIPLVLATVLAARNPDPSLRLQDIVATAVLIAALFGEALADWQLRSFKHMHSAHTSVCDHGLWRYSRHPNYFFEWMVWLAYPIFAIDFAGYNPFGWIGLSAPIVMYWLLVHISGVPPLEEHMHQSRGAAFRDYRRRTSVFFPWRLRSERRT